MFHYVTLEGPIKARNLKSLKPFFFFFFFFFALACEQTFIKTHNIESRFVSWPENILLVGVCMHISARKFYRMLQ